MESAKDIVEALRCSSSTDAACKKADCPYYSRVPKEQRREFCRSAKVNPKKISDEFWDDCDCERIAMDAAELIEELAGMKELVRVNPLSRDDLVKLEQAMSKSPCIDRIYAEV